MSRFRFLIYLFFVAAYSNVSSVFIYAENIESKGLASSPIVVNGDNVEYSTETQEVTAQGNVEIIYEGTKLTCKKLTVNTATKEGMAEGDARLEDARGVIEGERIAYDFRNKTGTIIDAGFRANPYFGKARKIERLDESEFIARYGYISTCSFDHPHYRIASKQMAILPGDRIETKHDTLYLGSFPLLYLPRFSHVLEDPMMHVRIMPGKSKDWGPYVLTGWKYSFTEHLSGRIYLDYRSNLGFAEGFGANYSIPYLGGGDFKFYYSEEKPKRTTLSAGAQRTEFQRYLLRWRHKWDISEQTNVITEFYKLGDQRRKYYDINSNILKDYFYREYEKDSEPLSYVLFHHSFNYSSLDIVAQKRVNHWFDQLDRLPQIAYTLPSIKLGETPLYFENSTLFANINKKASTYPTTTDELSMTRLDIINKVSMPMKLAFIDFTPFLKDRQVIYDKGADGKTLPVNTIFYAGADLSTKFYRMFNVKSNLLGLNIDGLRHIITPTISYSYNHASTISRDKLKYLDSVDLLAPASNVAGLGLSNKLQVKRKNSKGKLVSVDLVDINIGTSYSFAPRTMYGTYTYYQQNGVGVDEVDITRKKKAGAAFSDIGLNYKLLPYSWLRIEGDVSYKHSGFEGDPDFDNYKRISKVNYDISFDFSPERSLSFGQRYERKGGNQATANLTWRLNPKWKFSVYQRYNIKSFTDASNSFIKKGSMEQQFTLSRDLHCWEADLTLSNRMNHGSTIYLVFRLKAFPEAEFSFDQSYNKPKSGAQ